MKRLRKNMEPRNLFNASILLIVIMVVVSVAVNALTEPHMRQTLPMEGVTVSSVTFSGGNTVKLVVNNSGIVDFTVAEVWINNDKQPFSTDPAIGKISSTESMEISVNYAYVNGTSYNIKLVSDKKDAYFVSATAL
jgi:hypothetical protein